MGLTNITTHHPDAATIHQTTQDALENEDQVVHGTGASFINSQRQMLNIPRAFNATQGIQD